MKENTTNNDWDSIDPQAIIDGDQKAINYAYQQLIGWLLFITKNNEELSHDIFMKIISRMDRYIPLRSKLHNFIWTIGRNELYSFHRLKNTKKIKLSYETTYINNQSEVLSDEEYDQIEPDIQRLNDIFGTISDQEKAFMIGYCSTTQIKSDKSRAEFSKLKKKIKTNLKLS